MGAEVVTGETEEILADEKLLEDREESNEEEQRMMRVVKSVEEEEIASGIEIRGKKK